MQNNNNSQRSEKSALLVMDVQPNIVDRIQNKDEYLTSIKKAIQAAHAKQIPVIFVVVGFRPGAPEAKASQQQWVANMINPQPVISPESNDIVVTKRRVSAFSGSDLEVILRTQHIRHLVLTGIATSGVVLSTVREAADKDYELTVLSDFCADFDPEVHAVLINKIFPRQATVMTSEEWVSKL